MRLFLGLIFLCHKTLFSVGNFNSMRWSMPYPIYQLFIAKEQLIIWVFEKVVVIILRSEKIA